MSRTSTALAIALTTVVACAPPRDARARLTPRPSADGGTTVRDVAGEEGKTLESLFVGRFAGVTVTRAGGGLQIRIRGGNNSLLASNGPLYVVDGTPLSGGGDGILFLNPHDIERIEILKNPADVALYGFRGTNGVIKITTTRPGRR
jgi:TonB-dependent SusC/RagA subfamily outer membrane receptor